MSRIKKDPEDAQTAASRAQPRGVLLFGPPGAPRPCWRGRWPLRGVSTSCTSAGLISTASMSGRVRRRSRARSLELAKQLRRFCSWMRLIQLQAHGTEGARMVRNTPPQTCPVTMLPPAGKFVFSLFLQAPLLHNHGVVIFPACYCELAKHASHA